jgi:hypothetical protein
MDLSLEFLKTPAGVAAAFVVAGVGSYIVMLLKSRSEERHKMFIDVAQKLSSIGFKHLPKILTCLATSDLSGALREAKALWVIMHDKVQRVEELKDVAKNIMTDLYQDPSFRTEIDEFMQALRDKHLPDRASVGASVLDELADQKNLLEDAKSRLQAKFAKLGIELPPINASQNSPANSTTPTSDATAKVLM